MQKSLKSRILAEKALEAPQPQIVQPLIIIINLEITPSHLNSIDIRPLALDKCSPHNCNPGNPQLYLTKTQLPPGVCVFRCPQAMQAQH